jgi:hypothetical protein
MRKTGIIVAAMLILSLAAIGSVAAVDACHVKKPEYRPNLAFFYFSNGSSSKLIQDNHTQDTKMLKVVRQLDRTYNVTYYDLSLHPGYINMARFAYGVSSTPTVSVLGPDFPAIPSNFHNIAGYHDYLYMRMTISSIKWS